MTRWYKTGSFVTPGSGTTVIDVTSKGTNPKGAHFWGTGNSTGETIEANSQAFHGFSDGNDHRTMVHYAEAGASPNTQRIADTTDCIHIRNPTDDSILVGGFATMNANDVTITYNTGEFTAGQIVHYEIWGGTDVNAIVIEFAANSSPLTGVGFTSDLILFATAGNTMPGTSIHAFQSFGCAHDSGAGIDQWTLFSYMGDDDLDAIGSALAGGFNAGQIDVDFTAWQTTITVIGSDGFTWTGTNGDEIAALCLDFGGAGVDVGTFTKATGAAPVTQTLPDFGFVPMGYALCTAGFTSEAINVSQDCRTAFGAYDGTNAGSTITTTDVVDSNENHERSDTAEVLQISDNLTVDGVQASATPQAITDSTPDIEWNPNTGNADVIGYYAFEQAAGGPSIPVIMAGYRRRHARS